MGGIQTLNGECLSVVEIHIDEKWFVSNRQGGTVLVPPGVNLKPKAVANKRHPAQEIFLAAIAEPRPQHNGKIAMLPVTESVVAKNNTNKRKRGEIYEKSVTMTKTRFILMIKSSIVPLAVRSVHTWATHIVIQMDNAGGHGGGRSDMSKGTLLELQSWVDDLSIESRQTICKFVSQPARSPDLNVLDLGAWWSLEKAVGEVSTKSDSETWTEAVRKKVLCAWNKWDSGIKCAKIFSTLKLVWEKIREHQGGNDFIIPHQLKKKK